MPQRLAFATLALSIGLAATAVTARAQPSDDYGPDRRREHWEHERREHEWRERDRWERREAYERQYSQPGYYAPPPVYYPPPRTYYPPPPYAPPGVGLIAPYR